jgi:type VI secretion system secreted protein Hcp
MAVDAFLQFPKASTVGNIQPVGESTDKALLNAIELKAFTLGVENKTTIGSATAGGGSGKAQFAEFTITKRVDKASPSLLQACCLGVHFPEAVLSLRKAGASPTGPAVYLTYRFSLVYCTKVDTAGPGDEGPQEVVTFAYGAMQVSYQQQDATGKLAPAVTAQWDQTSNTAKYPATGA